MQITGDFTYSGIQTLWQACSSLNVASREAKIHHLFEQAKALYLENNERNWREVVSESIERRGNRYQGRGVTLFFPEDLPVIFIQASLCTLYDEIRALHAKLLENQEKMKKLCEEKGYQHVHIAEIGAHSPYSDILIQERLPRKRSAKTNIGFYLENKEIFTDAIKEFIELYLISNFSEIAKPCNRYSKTLKDLNSDENHFLGVYKGFSLYLAEGVPKIGILDFEAFNLSNGVSLCFHHCKDLIAVFPHHLNEILEIAKKIDPNIEICKSELELVRDKVLGSFKEIYEDHLLFLQNNNISLENPSQLVPITKEREKRIRGEVIGAILDTFKEKGQLKIFERAVINKGEHPHFRDPIEEIFPEILNIITSFLSKKLQDNLNQSPVTTYPELVSRRTLFFDEYTCDEDYKIMAQKVLTALAKAIERDAIFIDLDRLHFTIIKGVFKELAAGGELAYYNPQCRWRSLERDSSGKSCIFC